MKLSKSIWVAILIVVASWQPVWGKDKERDANKVIRQVYQEIIQNESYLTPKMHKEYWAALNKLLNSDPKEIKIFWDTLENGAQISAQRYLREAVLSTIASLKNRKKTYTPDYDRYRDVFLALGEKGGGTEALKKAVAQWEKNITTLGSKSYRPSAQTRANLNQVFDQELSKAVGILHRFDTLKQPSFAPKLVNRKFYAFPLSVSWPGEYLATFQDQKGKSGKVLKIAMLNHLVSENALTKIVLYRMGTLPKAIRETTLRKMAEGSLTEFGVKNDKQMKKETWRGLTTYHGEGRGVHQNLPSDVELRFMQLPNGQGVLGIFAISYDPDIVATDLFQRLEAGLQF